MFKTVLKISFTIFFIIIFCIPFAYIINILLNPFWIWFENGFGIEASGHSGPASWTFGVIYVFFVIIDIFVYWFKFKNKSEEQS